MLNQKQQALSLLAQSKAAMDNAIILFNQAADAVADLDLDFDEDPCYAASEFEQHINDFRDVLNNDR
jgi:hypothetical protein